VNTTSHGRQRRNIKKEQQLRTARKLYRVKDMGTSNAALGDLVVSYELLRQLAKGRGV
jgi:hypothetical protein